MQKHNNAHPRPSNYRGNYRPTRFRQTQYDANNSRQATLNNNPVRPTTSQTLFCTKCHRTSHKAEQCIANTTASGQQIARNNTLNQGTFTRGPNRGQRGSYSTFEKKIFINRISLKVTVKYNKNIVKHNLVRMI